VSTTNGNTLAYSATCTAACVGVLDYPVWNGNGGTFTISVNGTPITNPFGGGTTFYNSGFAGATITSTIAIAASSSSKSAVRFPMSTGSNTVTVTVTSATGGGNTVGVNWFALVPVASTNNPPVEALSLQYQNNSNDSLSGTYSGFISSIITQAATDGLNAYFANIRAAILNTNVPINLYVNGAGTSYTPTGWVANTGVSYAVTQTPLTLVGSSPAQGQYAESAGTYTFNISDAATPLSVGYTINCGATESVMFTNCYADALHPNDFGHAVYESVAASSLPSRYVTGNNVPQSTQPYRNYLTNGVFPNQMITPSLLGSNTPISNGGFNPGYSYGCFVGQCYWTGVSNNGLTTFLPYTGGSVVWDLRVLNCGNVQPTANCPYTDFDTLTANGVRTFNSVTNTFNGGVSVNQGGNTAPSFRGPLVAINDSGYFYPTIPTFQLANATNQGETGLRIVGGLTFETGVTGGAQVAGSGQCTPANIWYLADFTGGTCVLREWVGASGVHNFASGITSPTITATTLTDGTCSISGGVLSGCSGGGGSYPLYNASGTLQTSAHTVIGTATVSASNVTVTLSGSAVFTSASSYACTYSPESSTNGFVPITYTSGSAFVLNGDTSGFDGTVRYICTGN
jgi:hypothetical protein